MNHPFLYFCIFVCSCSLLNVDDRLPKDNLEISKSVELLNNKNSNKSFSFEIPLNQKSRDGYVPFNNYNLETPDNEVDYFNSCLNLFKSVLVHKKENKIFSSSNSIVSPFLHTSSGNGKISSIDELRSATNSKINIFFDRNISDNLDIWINRAIWIKSNWSEVSTENLSSFSFRGKDTSGFKISGYCYYYENANMRLFCLPGDLEFDVYLVSSKKSDIKKTIHELDFSSFNRYLQKMKKVKCELGIPSFKFYNSIFSSDSSTIVNFLQIDNSGIEFCSVSLDWRFSIPADDSDVDEFDAFSAPSADTPLFSDYDNLDLGNIKARYLKNFSNAYTSFDFNESFLLFLRSRNTGELINICLIDRLGDFKDKYTLSNKPSPNYSKKDSVINRFGWGFYTPPNVNPFGNDGDIEDPFGNDGDKDPFGNDGDIEDPFGNDEEKDPFSNDGDIKDPFEDKKS